MTSYLSCFGPHIAQKLTKKLDRFWNEKIAILRSAPAIIFFILIMA